jgi:single-strand DNA-binding protein
MSVNSTLITAVGRVVSAITARVIPSGAKVASFRIACQERVFDKAQDRWVDGDRVYMRVTCWRRLAENVADSLREGDQILVRGRLKIRTYETKDGAERTEPEIDAWSIGPDLTLHTVTVNRSDWAVSPNQERLLDPSPVRLVEEDSTEETPTQEGVVQAA